MSRGSPQVESAAGLARRRLQNSGLVGYPFARPQDVVGWFGAVQAQDYAGATWGIGQRTAATTGAAIDSVFDAGGILRTHVLRPTWHFVMPGDIRWLLALTGPRVKAAGGYQYRQLGLDERLVARAHAAMVRALEGGRRLTRPEIGRACGQAGVDVSGPRLAMVVMLAELDALVCSGPRRGRRFTYALLEERVAPARPLDRGEALAELARRYFASHGPAQAIDFAWWSGLTVTDARTGIDAAGRRLQRVTLGEETYWAADGWPAAATSPDTGGDWEGLLPGPGAAGTASPSVHLLPSWDELTVGYRDRRALLDPRLPDAGPAFVLSNVVVRDGRIVGSWRRTLDRDRVTVTVDVVAPADAAMRSGLEDAARRYGEFLARRVTLAQA